MLKLTVVSSHFLFVVYHILDSIIILFIFQEDGYLYSALMVFASFLTAILSTNFNYYVSKIALKIRCAISIALYDKVSLILELTYATFNCSIPSLSF